MNLICVGIPVNNRSEYKKLISNLSNLSSKAYLTPIESFKFPELTFLIYDRVIDKLIKSKFDFINLKIMNIKMIEHRFGRINRYQMIETNLLFQSDFVRPESYSMVQAAEYVKDYNLETEYIKFQLRGEHFQIILPRYLRSNFIELKQMFLENKL